MIEGIGGYFELELPKREEYHKDALRLNSGKNCLEYILLVRKYKKVYIPYYTCDVVLKPFLKLGIAYQFYHINFQFEIAEEISLGVGEALLYTNYYGLKQQYVEHLVGRFGKSLIVDNTQAFYAKPLEGIDTFYTCRNFFGVPDGAYLYTDAPPIQDLKRSVSYNRMEHLIKRIDLSPSEGFEDFHKNDDRLSVDEIMLMSHFTQRMMESIDYAGVAQKRQMNYMQLHDYLKSSNQLNLSMCIEAVPMVYPYLSEIVDLRQHLISNKVFIAKYWPNVIGCTKEDSVETKLTKQLLPLPIDQRYGNGEMNEILNVILK
jgi:hypothetical protein